MITAGRVVGLIQAMGGGADPAAIEAAVQDWLDNHPEATTTVQDGSITEQKLATSIAQKLGLISSLSDEIDAVNSKNLPVALTFDVNDLRAAVESPMNFEYTVTRVGTWQNASYAVSTITGITAGDVIRIQVSEIKRHSQGIGAIYAYDASGTAVGNTISIPAYALKDNAVLYDWTVPENVASAKVTIYLIGNYASGDAPIVGETVYVKNYIVYKKGTLTPSATGMQFFRNSVSGKANVAQAAFETAEFLPSANVVAFGNSAYYAKIAETWRTESYFQHSVLLNEGDIITLGCAERVGTGTSVGIVVFYDSNGDSLLERSIGVSTSEGAITTVTNQYGGFAYTYVAPQNTASATCKIFGVGNAASTPGTMYYIRDAFVAIGTIPHPNISIPVTWENRLQEMQTAQGTALVFGVQSDTHFYSGLNRRCGLNLNNLTRVMGMDFIANLGDIIQGYSTYEYLDAPLRTRQSMTEIVARYTENAECPVLLLAGNHDSNIMHHNAYGSDEFSNAEIYARIYKPSFNTFDKSGCINGKLYYYVDFPAARVIVVNTGDTTTVGGFAVSDEQKTWFENIALNTTKPVLVLSHVPLVDGWSASSNYVSDYAKITNALVAYKTSGGIVLGCMSGHMHKQESQTVDGILYVTFTQSFLNPDTAEIVMIDTDAMKIRTFGFGSASDRSWTL